MASFSFDTTYSLIDGATGTVVAVYDGLLYNELPHEEDADQQWLLEDAGNGLSHIRSGGNSSLYIDAGADSQTQMPCTDQKWPWRIVKYQSDPSCLIVLTPGETRCMNLLDGNSNQGAKIVTHTVLGGHNQAWIFKATP
ncbi:hypothetical protein DL93DRAFT_1384944 [Clavulina sp. PMI_390]|nr:hypothetical protein DL93DRAFT_1384944 [Clavulina sp. PMI_390]